MVWMAARAAVSRTKICVFRYLGTARLETNRYIRTINTTNVIKRLSRLRLDGGIAASVGVEEARQRMAWHAAQTPTSGLLEAFAKANWVAGSATTVFKTF